MTTRSTPGRPATLRSSIPTPFNRHFNDGDVTAKALVIKAKSTWMYFTSFSRFVRVRSTTRTSSARVRSGPDLDAGSR